MNIGIDIDNTLTNSSKTFNKYLKDYCRKHHLKRYSKEKRVSDEHFLKFLDDYGQVLYSQMKLKKNAKKVLTKWKEKNYKIYFITARHESTCLNVEKYTKDFLKNNDITYDDILFVLNNKYIASKDLKLDIYIDDYEKELGNFKDKNTLLIKFVKNKKYASNYLKVKSWKELEKIVEEESKWKNEL